MLISCKQEQQSPQGTWITGDEQEKLNHIERMFRGFDVTMVEVGYRYNELYWAGNDFNWPYAAYQLEKMELSLKDGLHKRPLRAATAEHFINVILPEMNKVIKTQDSMQFANSFQNLTISCNSCHAMEKVPFFRVNPPLTRQSPIRLEKP